VTLKNGTLEVDITNFGATIVGVRVPDRTGKIRDVVLGYDTFEEYKKDKCYFGGIVGRVANRIADGRYKINGKTYEVKMNEGSIDALHGGEIGFNQVYWEIKHIISNADNCALELHYLSKDRESGFPGNLLVVATYELNNKNEIVLHIKAKSDQDTIVNLTNHAYWNLNGCEKDILGTILKLESSHFVPGNERLIPLGNLAPVSNTPFDFRTPHSIGSRINDNHPQLKIGSGYDHTFVIDQYSEHNKEPILACTATDNSAGIRLKIYTTQPGVQFYTGNFLSSVHGKNGSIYNKRDAFCLETQHYPDAINQPSFPSILLKSGNLYSHTIKFHIESFTQTKL